MASYKLLVGLLPNIVMMAALVDLVLEYLSGNYPKAQIAATLLLAGLLMEICDILHHKF